MRFIKYHERALCLRLPHCIRIISFSKTIKKAPIEDANKKEEFRSAERIFCAAPLVSKLLDSFGLNANSATCVASFGSAHGADITIKAPSRGAFIVMTKGYEKDIF